MPRRKTRRAAFNQFKQAISGCDWGTAVSTLLNLLTIVITLGPYADPNEADSAIDQMAALLKARIRDDWHLRHTRVLPTPPATTETRH
jgi:hypothetical protein